MTVLWLCIWTQKHHFQVFVSQPKFEEEKDVGILKRMCCDMKSTEAGYSMASQQDNEGITTSKKNRPNIQIIKLNVNHILL